MDLGYSLCQGWFTGTNFQELLKNKAQISFLEVSSRSQIYLVHHSEIAAVWVLGEAPGGRSLNRCLTLGRLWTLTAVLLAARNSPIWWWGRRWNVGSCQWPCFQTYGGSWSNSMKPTCRERGRAEAWGQRGILVPVVPAVPPLLGVCPYEQYIPPFCLAVEFT